MNPAYEELQALCEATIEGRLTLEQTARLEQLVLGDHEMRRYYVEYVHQHSSLRWSAAEPALLGPRPPVVTEGRVDAPANFPRHAGRWNWPAAGGLVAAAALLVAMWIALRPPGDRSQPLVATLVDGKACKWEGGALPTELGARLPAGRLRLAEGVARLRFSEGAEVSVEAPAELELVSPRRCVLHAGRLIAKVPPHAIGFTVDTTTAVIKDLGTEFGVNVADGKTADVQVFDGRVDVLHRGSGRTEAMRTGENLRFAPNEFAAFDPMAEHPAPDRPAGVGSAPRLIQISSATGHGKDAYIRPPIPMKTGPYALLLVKNTKKDDHSRKAYIGLDLTSAVGMTIVDAQLSLTFAPTGLGYASEVPDADFAVYGLTDESLDGWDEAMIDWANAPANHPGGSGVDPAKTALLGRFTMEQGVQSGAREIFGKDLVDFLNRDTNGMATLIVVRETVGSGRFDLVHGFAGKNHPDLPPPTVKLRVKDSHHR
jgi:hypothetical protein